MQLYETRLKNFLYYIFDLNIPKFTERRVRLYCVSNGLLFFFETSPSFKAKFSAARDSSAKPEEKIQLGRRRGLNSGNIHFCFRLQVYGVHLCGYG
jgi:hypothetical protein